MQSADKLLAAAEQVDVLDAAGRIIANPKRAAIAAPAATVLALASATERFWAVCIEAELLVRALARPTTDFTSEEQFAIRDHAIQTQAEAVSRLMLMIRLETQTLTSKENENANG